MKKVLFSLLIAALSLSAVAQHKICFSTEAVNNKRATDPNYNQQMQQQEQVLRKWVNTGTQDPYYSARVVRTIPVAVHILYNTTAQNVSDAAVQTMINQLNADYRKLNSDFSTARSVVQALGADAQIEFCLAQQKPDGSATNGIEHVFTNEACYDVNTETDKMKSSTTGGANAWNPQKYLNIWIVHLCGSSPQTGGVAGYAYIPATGNGLHGSSIDGVVIDYSIGLGAGNRTWTHEVGHYLGLHHVWGDLSANACGNVFPDTDDGFSDTPDSKAANFGCPLNTASCTGNSSYGDQVENYMDYSDCTVMFTTQQANYMNSVLTNIRSSLVTNNNVCSTSGAPVAAFTANQTTICTGQSVTFTNQSTGTNLTYSWQFQGGTPSTSTAQNPTVTYNTAGSYNVTLTVTGTGGNDAEVKSAYITVSGAAALPLAEGFEGTTFAPTGWSINNTDADLTWVRTTSASGFGTSSASAYVNNYNYNSPGQWDWLITPSYSFSGVSNGRIKWDYAYAPYTQSGYEDSLDVMYSTNCGATWTSLWKKGGSGLGTATASANNFVPTASQWKKDSVSLASLNGQANVRFAFRNANKYGNNIFLDNVNVYNAAAGGGSAPVVDFIGTPTTVVAGNTVAFTDLSTNTPTTWSWTFAGGTPGTSTTQNPTITYSTPGTYNVTLTASNANGGNTVTKTGYITVVNAGAQSCDTLSNLYNADTLTYYQLSNGYTGYVTGNNSLGDLAMAEYYPNTTTAQVTGVLFYFIKAISPLPASHTITVKVWDATGTGGTPGTVLASQSRTISSLSTTGITSVTFTTPPTVTGDFFVGYDLPTASGDTVTVVSTLFSSPAPDYGYNQWDDQTWHLFSDTYGAGNDLDIFALPVLCTGSSVTPPTAAFTANKTSVCAGGTVNFTSTSTGNPTSYTWTFQGGSPAASTSQNPTVTYSTPGTYNVSLTASNAGGPNTVTQNSYITVYANPSATTSTTAVACYGASTGSATVTATGGSSPYTYSWSGGGSTATISNKPSGSYTVTVTDNHQCSTTASVNISQPLGPLSLAPNVNDAVCNQQNGSASVTATGGAGGYTYHWNNNATTQTLNNVGPGSYAVTVTDANACTATLSMTVNNQSSNLSVSINATNASCGQNNGQAVAVPNNGNFGITYVWNTGATSGSLSNLSAGTYSVTITNSNGCTASASTTISSSTVNINVTFNTTNANCGSSNGSATATVNGGTSPYTYNWSNGGTTAGISNVPAGGYTLTVTDNSGCSVSNVATISNQGAPTVSITPTSPTCFGGSNGSATASASGGNPPYTYNWNTGGTNASINNVGAGSYVVSVTDAQQCLAVQSVTLTNPAQMNVNIATTPATCGTANGTAAATVTGGNGNYSFTWSTGTSQQAISNLAGGSYTVTVIDGSGCTAVSTTQISSQSGPTSVLSPTDGTCQIAAQINVTVLGGTAPYTFQWSNGALTEDLTGIAAGAYTVTITDANGCKNINNASVSDNSSVNISFTTNEPTQGQNNGSATVNPTGGTTPYSYAWSTGSTSQTASNLGAGSYTVTVTDNSGCVKIGTVTLVAVGINDVNNNISVQMFPNPANQSVNVKLELNKPQHVELDMFNGIGQLLWNKSLNDFQNGTEQITLSELPQGIYMVRITTPAGNRTLRLVKE